uniref:Glycosyltransferase n=1 Tax=viral metagenome TaxID=1070528 RepID=A0A6M3IJI4_9ZZZZ
MKLVFCLPGDNFSGNFLNCWTQLVLYCLRTNIQFSYINRKSNNIYYVRNMCLGADVQRGKNQKPFDGKIDYDYLVWIDSDSVFAPDQVQSLLNCNKDIVGALQSFEGGNGFTCGRLDEEFFKENGYMPYITPDGLKDEPLTEDGLIELDYVGFGLLCIKKGVFESMEYPWFRPKFQEIGECCDFSMEDVSFCVTAKEKGFNIYVNPGVRIGHEKLAIY